MEAARALQLRDQSVELRGGTVVIEALIVDDRTLVELVEHRLERDIPATETVVGALEIGARVLDREATHAEVDVVKREFERVAGEVEHAFVEKAAKAADDLQERLEEFLSEDGGTMARTLDSQSEQLGELIVAHFGAERSTAVQHQIRELIARLLSDSRQELLRQFSAEDGHNPLADFKSSIVREVQGARKLNETLIEKLAQLHGDVQRLHDAREAQTELEAERERGTSKGRDFEQRVFELLDELACARGDVAHHVGDAPSATGGKRGDVVIEVDAASGPSKGRIAFDAKDERLSKGRAWEVLNTALEERDAGFAVLVVASDAKLPAGRDQLQEYEGNKMIVVLDKESFDGRALELAYRYARCRCLMVAEKELELDAAGVRDAAEEALCALKDAQRVRRSLTGATNSVENAREALDAMVARVEASLARVESLIAAS